MFDLLLGKSDAEKIAEWFADIDVNATADNWTVDKDGLVKTCVGYYAFHRDATGGYSVLWSPDSEALRNPIPGDKVRLCGRLDSLDKSKFETFLQFHQKTMAQALAYFGNLYKTAPNIYESGLSSYKITKKGEKAEVTVYFDHTSELDLVSTKDRLIFTGLNVTDTQSFDSWEAAEAFIRADAKQKFKNLLEGNHDGFKDKLDEDKLKRRAHKAIVGVRDTVAAVGGGALLTIGGVIAAVPFAAFPALALVEGSGAGMVAGAIFGGPLLAPGLAIRDGWRAIWGHFTVDSIQKTLRPLSAEDLSTLNGAVTGAEIPVDKKVEQFDAVDVQRARARNLFSGGLQLIIETAPKNDNESYVMFRRDDGRINLRNLNKNGRFSYVADYDTDMPGIYLFGTGERDELFTLKVKDDGTRLKYRNPEEKLVAVGLPGEPLKPYASKEDLRVMAAQTAEEQDRLEQAVVAIEPAVRPTL